MALVSTSLFCCSQVIPYRPRNLEHERKFQDFLRWAQNLATYPAFMEQPSTDSIPPYAVQLVQQVNYGPLENRRYFIPAPTASSTDTFTEVKEEWLIQMNFAKLNSYKNFKCIVHNKFFEVNLYQKDPVNKHHWRANVARPADQIDL